MTFAPKPGCPMCSIAQAASMTPQNTPSTPVFSLSQVPQPEILWRDDNFTAYLEKNNPVSSKGHIIILFNLHVPSIYSLSSSDLPLLVQVQRRAQQLLHILQRPSSSQSPDPYHTNSPIVTSPLTSTLPFHIGFITPPFKDSKIPVTDHLHAHAYIGTPDLAGWWRKTAYSYLGWYAIDDLIAEIRETTSNNRVKSGYPNRGPAPIDMVPDAGSRSGRPDGIETTEQSLAFDDVENLCSAINSCGSYYK
ncbi:hypothetical protein BU17DRAFT_73578 [Hysterangium stoloniferum]|nr:hypothetical protein BU17DRAFT_73578 [Hysterangium stoloniferum]